eukprot:g17939.t1
MEPEALGPGGSARLRNLVARADLNGENVVILHWVEKSQRWAVQTVCGSTLSVRPENLEPVWVEDLQSSTLEAIISKLSGGSLSLEQRNGCGGVVAPKLTWLTWQCSKGHSFKDSELPVKEERWISALVIDHDLRHSKYTHEHFVATLLLALDTLGPRHWTVKFMASLLPWQWKPAAAAGQSTFEHDRPGTARHFLVTGGFTGTWRDGFPGVTMDGFCRSSGFTRKNFFDTGRQSHIPNFRQIATASPNREGDVYPTGVRELKTELLNTLLSLLEGRMDNRIHQTVVQRGDPLELTSYHTILAALGVFSVLQLFRRWRQTSMPGEEDDQKVSLGRWGLEVQKNEGLDIFQGEAFGQRFVVVTDPAMAEELCSGDPQRFTKDMRQGRMGDLVYKLFGQGLFFVPTDDPRWQIAHNILKSPFSIKGMKVIMPLMCEQAENLDAWVTKMAFETIAVCGLGTPLGSFEDAKQHPWVSAFNDAMKFLGQSWLRMTPRFLWPFLFPKGLERFDAEAWHLCEGEGFSEQDALETAKQVAYDCAKSVQPELVLRIWESTAGAIFKEVETGRNIFVFGLGTFGLKAQQLIFAPQEEFLNTHSLDPGFFLAQIPQIPRPSTALVASAVAVPRSAGPRVEEMATLAAKLDLLPRTKHSVATVARLLEISSELVLQALQAMVHRMGQQMATDESERQ